MGTGASTSRGEEGFTLAELLVFLAIMLILLVGIGGMISSGAKSSTASYNLVKLENAANEAVVAMTRQIRVATAIDAGSNEQAITFVGFLDGSEKTSVTLALQEGSITRNGASWIEDVESMQIAYFDERGERLSPGTPGWNTLVHRVDFELVFSKESMGLRLSRTYQGTVTLRNSLDQA